MLSNSVFSPIPDSIPYTAADAASSFSIAKRHALEGRARIARQRQMLEELAIRGDDRLIYQGRQLLDQMIAFQRAAEDHLRSERERSLFEQL